MSRYSVQRVNTKQREVALTLEQCRDAGHRYCDDIYETLQGADALVLMTEWNAYRGLDLDDVMARMPGRVFVDLRNVYEPAQMREQGFEYVGVGR